MSAFRSGFVAVVGRPNVGKSTLVNTMVGTKVTITSPRPNTTRSQVRGVLDRPDAQVVFVDTPGLHKPRTALGERMNESATSSLDDVDVVLAMVEASGAVGPGDRMVLTQSAHRVRSMARAAALRSELRPAGGGRGGGHPDSAGGGQQDRPGRRGRSPRPSDRGVRRWSSASTRRPAGRRPRSSTSRCRPPPARGWPPWWRPRWPGCPTGPRYYPEGMVTDVAEAFWVADLVREELLHRVQDELPHCIACRVTEWEWPRVRCEILVERDSQKGIVIGKGGATLKEVGTAVRAQMPPGAYLELFVRVEKHWQQREDALDRLGF